MIHFIVLQEKNMLLITNSKLEKLRAKYGSKFEIVNSLKDDTYLETIKQRVVRSYPKLQVKVSITNKIDFTEEVREKLRQKKLGKPRPDWVREKISRKMKGTSNFQGKRHKGTSKMKTALALMDNKNIDGHVFIYNPTTDEERRVKDIINLPEGFRVGRNPQAIEPMLFKTW